MVLVYEFMQENKEFLKKFRTYTQMVTDREFYFKKFNLATANAWMAKKILTGEYDTITDLTIAKKFRDYAREIVEYEGVLSGS